MSASGFAIYFFFFCLGLLVCHVLAWYQLSQSEAEIVIFYFEYESCYTFINQGFPRKQMNSRGGMFWGELVHVIVGACKT